MSHDEGGIIQTPPATAESGIPHLTRRDVDRLTNYKWRYSLESHGFSAQQAEHLLFMRWLFRRGGVRG